MGRADAAAPSLRVELVYSPSAGLVNRIALTLAPGATVAEALAQSGWALPDGVQVGVWGRVCGTEKALRDRDRVELYRPLAIDPKEARRQRQRAQGKRSPK